MVGLNKCLRMNIKDLLCDGSEMTLHLILENSVFKKVKQEQAIWKLGFHHGLTVVPCLYQCH